MRLGSRIGVGWLVVVLLAVGCAAPAQPSGQGAQSSGTEPQRPAAPKRLAIAMLGEPPAMWDDINPSGGTVPGMAQFEGLVTSGLTVVDAQGARYPQLAEAVPTTDNGLWKLLPDGKMETTWRLREGVRWHDGQPFTTADLVFSATVAMDRELSVFRKAPFDLIERIDAPDPRTITATWSSPYIGADQLFGVGSDALAPPMPKHLLERPFTENKATFTEIPYWTSDFISSGAYRLREWSAGSHAVLDAFPDYVLGRPKIDVVEVKFIPDPSTLLANVLTGTVELTFTRAVSIEQAIPVRDQWKDGSVVPYINGWTMMYPQLRAPTPAALADPQLRRALTLAIDRQQIADVLTAGLAQVADSIIAPNQPEYRFIESSIARFPYDARRAAQLIESTGLVKGSDGFYRDAAGQRAVIEIRTTTNDANQKATFAIADYFQRAGIGAEPVVIPVARLQDREYRVTYTGLELVNQPHGPDGFEDLMHSSAAPLPERGFRAPNSNKNRGSYMNADYDALMDRYKMTIPVADRMRVMGQLIQQQTDLQLAMGIFYTVDAIMVSNRLDSVFPGSSWNAHAWDVKA